MARGQRPAVDGAAGAGIGKIFHFRKAAGERADRAYYNVVKPDLGPTGSFVRRCS